MITVRATVIETIAFQIRVSNMAGLLRSQTMSSAKRARRGNLGMCLIYTELSDVICYIRAYLKP